MPDAAKDRRQDGRVLSSAIVRGSGDPSFDEAGLAMTRRSDPVPKRPPPAVQQGLSFTLPVIHCPGGLYIYSPSATSETKNR
jgi:TonB family protein